MGYINVWEHSGGDRHFDVDWSSIIEDLYSPELEGCVQPEGTIASARDPLKSTLILLEPLDLEAIASLGRRIDGQQAQEVPPQDGARYDLMAPPPPPPNIAVTWEYFDEAPVASLPAKFRMPEIERYMGIGCPRIHLRLYSTIMRAHGLNEAQMIMLFPISLSGAAQRWFASLDVSCRRTWDDLAQEFLRQFTFNNIIDVSRRELEALRQRPEELVTSFISRWREKISQVIDRPSERDQISMIMRSLQPQFARPLMRFSHTDFGSLVQALYGLRPPRRYQTVGQTFGLYYPPSPRVQYRPREPSQSYDQTYMPPALALPHHTAQGIERPTVSYSAAALRKLTEVGLLTALTPRPPPQLVPPKFRMDLHYVDEVQTPYVDVSHTPYVDDAHTLDVQYVIRGGKVIKVKTTTTPEGLIHMVKAGRATCIVFLDDDLPLKVLRIPTSFNLLLGRPWIHRAETIPSFLHQKISHSDDDLFLTRFTFDEVQTLEMEDFYLDYVAMSFDQHGSTVVLEMMRSMFYLPGVGEGSTDSYAVRLSCLSIHHEFGGLLRESIRAINPFKRDHWGTQYHAGGRATTPHPSVTVE
ncbi:hypothetical protein CK203_087242 [Vitis vinifera]|uniref:Retrotransposon gag domain-containing protein n=1 Tax=Vitis vinifera TaxID=29760 RepID=A0A438BM11_VITVI|nr:hypothetical protein CK203_087242 [Vitis vinifera]